MIATSTSTKPTTLLAGILIMFVFLFLFSLSGTQTMLHLFGIAQINAVYLLGTRLAYWLCLLIVWLFTSKIEKQPLLLWQEKQLSFLFYLLSVIILAASIALSTGIAQHIVAAIIHKKEHSDRLQEMVEIFRTNKVLLVFTALTAGVTEELLFRGYLLPRLEVLFKNVYIAIFISSLLFGLVHYRYGTLDNAVGPFIIGLIFAIYYWKFRNIRVLIFFHFVWDVFGLFVLLKH